MPGLETREELALAGRVWDSNVLVRYARDQFNCPGYRIHDILN
jgi:hypothetical protein